MKLFILLMVVKVMNPETHKLQDDYYLLNYKNPVDCKNAATLALKSENVEKAYCTEFPKFVIVE